MKKTGITFMENTKYQNISVSDQNMGMPQPQIERAFNDEGLIKLQIPKSDKKSDVNFLELINQRRSVRIYDEKPLSKEDLSFFLWCSQGVKKISTITLRTVPSAGARHAIETYLLINNVEGITPGLYRYIASIHSLAPINLEADIATNLMAGCLGQGMVSNSAITFFWSADIYRMSYRYSERSYRYIHLDAGHICQNLHLAAESKGCGVCAIAAFDDDVINKLLGLDGINDFVIYVGTLGRKNG